MGRRNRHLSKFRRCNSFGIRRSGTRLFGTAQRPFPTKRYTFSLFQSSRRTQPCRPPRPLRSRSNAPTRPVCSPSGFSIRQISHSAPVAPCTAHLCPTPCAQHVQPLNVPVREPVHVQYWAVAWSDRVGLLGLALALRARADIEVCAVGEDAASRQGSSTDGQARSWLARRCSGRSMSSIMEEDG